MRLQNSVCVVRVAPTAWHLTVERVDAVADAGYFKIKDMEACENACVVLHIPKLHRSSGVSPGLFRKERFRSEGDEDIYI